MYGFKDRKPDELSSGFATPALSEKLSNWRDLKKTKNHFADKIEQLIMNPPKDVEGDALRDLSWLYETLISI